MSDVQSNSNDFNITTGGRGVGTEFVLWEERSGKFEPIYFMQVCRNTLRIFSWFVGIEEFLEGRSSPL